jgi:hypothetical protein
MGHVHIGGQSEGPIEAAIGPLHTVIVLVARLLLELALTFQCEHAVLDVQLDILVLEARDLEREDQLILRLLHVDGRGPHGRNALLFSLDPFLDISRHGRSKLLA